MISISVEMGCVKAVSSYGDIQLFTDRNPPYYGLQLKVIVSHTCFEACMHDDSC